MAALSTSGRPPEPVNRPWQCHLRRAADPQGGRRVVRWGLAGSADVGHHVPPSADQRGATERAGDLWLDRGENASGFMTLAVPTDDEARARRCRRHGSSRRSATSIPDSAKDRTRSHVAVTDACHCSACPGSTTARGFHKSFQEQSLTVFSWTWAATSRVWHQARARVDLPAPAGPARNNTIAFTTTSMRGRARLGAQSSSGALRRRSGAPHEDPCMGIHVCARPTRRLVISTEDDLHQPEAVPWADDTACSAGHAWNMPIRPKFGSLR